MDTNSCSNFVLEDCNYPDEAIFYDQDEGEIRDPSHCQDQCRVFESQCKYWVFRSNQFSENGTTRCTLYRDFNVPEVCHAVNGPQYPHREDCSDGNDFILISITVKNTISTN